MTTPATPQAGLQSQIFSGVDVSGTVTYTPINNVENIDGPHVSQAVIELAVLGNEYKGKLPGQSDPGEVTFTQYYNTTDTSSQLLTNLWGTQTIVPWKISYPDGGYATFKAFLSDMDIKGMSADEAVTADVTLTLTGGCTFTPGP